MKTKNKPPFGGKICSDICPRTLSVPSLRKQPSFFAPGPSVVSQENETPLGPGAKKDGRFPGLYLFREANSFRERRSRKTVSFDWNR